MRFILIIVLGLLNVSSFSQDKFLFEWDGKSFIDTLKSNDVDTVCTIRNCCIGSISINENDIDSICDKKDWRYFDLYVFWRQKGRDYMKKFNNCFEFEAIQLDSIKFLNYFIDNQSVLFKEKLKPAIGIEKINKGDTTFIVYDIDHYCELDITIDINSKKYQKKFYDYIFETSSNELNGERNKRLKSFKLYKLINEEKDFIERKYKPKIFR